MKQKFIIEAESKIFEEIKKFDSPDVQVFSGRDNGWVNITIPFMLKKVKRGRPVKKEAGK